MAYWSTYEIQWSNFASWLLVGAMVVSSITLAFSLLGLLFGSRSFFYVLALAATWVVGFLNSLQHARDAWGIMPTALVWSIVATLLALLATWAGFSSLRAGDAR